MTTTPNSSRTIFQRFMTSPPTWAGVSLCEAAFRRESVAQACRWAIRTVSLSELYPGSAHVVEFDLLERPDREIWDFALKGGFPTIDFPAVFISESISARQHRRRIRGSALCCTFGCLCKARRTDYSPVEDKTAASRGRAIKKRALCRRACISGFTAGMCPASFARSKTPSTPVTGRPA